MTMPEWTTKPPDWMAMFKRTSIVFAVLVPLCSGAIWAFDEVIGVTRAVDDFRNRLVAIEGSVATLNRIGESREQKSDEVARQLASHSDALKADHESIAKIDKTTQETNDQLAQLMIQLLGKKRSAANGGQ